MAQELPPFVQALDDGVFAVDTGCIRERFDAAYLIVERGRAAFIDTGTHRGVPRLLAALDALGVARTAVDYVIPTHVHLDHGGGAGTLMRALPAATLLVHPRGVRHMVDPSALWEGATAVYGAEEMARTYGEVVPVPAERIRATHDGMAVALAGRPLEFADTPGHARHHHCIWDERSRGWFTGDAFGQSYREFDTAQGPWVMLGSPPVQFEPELFESSVHRLLAREPRWIYLTHYGRVGDVPRLGAQLLALLDELVAMARKAWREQATARAREQALRAGQLEVIARRLAQHGCRHTREQLAEFLALDIELNTQGIAIWLAGEAVAAGARR